MTARGRTGSGTTTIHVFNTTREAADKIFSVDREMEPPQQAEGEPLRPGWTSAAAGTTMGGQRSITVAGKMLYMFWEKGSDTSKPADVVDEMGGAGVARRSSTSSTVLVFIRTPSRGQAEVIRRTTDPGVQLIDYPYRERRASPWMDVERRCDRPRGSVRRWLRSARPHGG